MPPEHIIGVDGIGGSWYSVSDADYCVFFPIVERLYGVGYIIIKYDVKTCWLCNNMSNRISMSYYFVIQNSAIHI